MKKYVSILYRLLDCLPTEVSMKIKLILNVLYSDWRFFPSGPFFPFAEKFSSDYSEELKQIEKFLDNESITTVRAFLEKCHCENKFLNMLEPFRNSLFIDFSKIRKHFILPVSSGALKEARKKYHLKTGGLESLVFHQGVTFLTEKQIQYFEGKIVVDGGAYFGHYAIPYLKNYPFSCLWAFEPDSDSRKQFARNMKKNHIFSERYRQFSYGLGEKEEIIMYNGQGIDLQQIGNDKCEIVTLDSIAEKFNSVDRIGLIKADVEGMGLQLLKGAVNVIRKSQPVLALSAYHSPEELFGQILFVCHNFPGYQCRFVDLPAGSGYELTLLAIPEKLKSSD